MRYHLLACDYDGTLAKDGHVDDATVAALERLRESGRKLALVTGRQLADLLAVFPRSNLCECIVAENGGVLYFPHGKTEIALGAEPARPFIARLEEAGVGPLAVGRVIVATWTPHETAVLAIIRELGLELQVVFNKGAVMVLPSGINKRTGLAAALKRMRLSEHNCAGVGDAENDHAFLSICECSAAVANALPAVKDAVDWVLPRDHGAGVATMIRQLLDDDLASIDETSTKHHIPIATQDDGGVVSVPIRDSLGLIAGSSGGGKTRAAAGMLEVLAERGYQVCVVDPEGDHTGIDGAVVAGSTEQVPELEQVTRILEEPHTHAVVNLLGVRLSERPRFFVSLMTRIVEMRARTGRPHWLVIDEAHHVLDSSFEPSQRLSGGEVAPVLLITVHPERLPRALLARATFALAVGSEAADALAALAAARDVRAPATPRLPEGAGEALWWRPREPVALRVSIALGRAAQRRHRRKYAQGELGPDKSFYFRGAAGRLNLRAWNLMAFNELGAGVDDDTWSFHLERRDYSAWVREAIKDRRLAEQIAEVEEQRLSPAESRNRIRELIEASYTSPA